MRAVRHPLNVAGDFFVQYDLCLACDAPRSEAPDLMDYDSNGHCYFKRQPQNPEELDRAISAVRVSCIEAVLYDGKDPNIWAKINEMPCFLANTPIQTSWERLADKTLSLLRRVLHR